MPTPQPIALEYPEHCLVVADELSLQVLGTLSNGFLAEFIDWTPPDLFVDMPKCEDGHFRIPDRPGHGMSLTPDAVKKYRV